MSDPIREAWATWISAQGPWHVFGALTYDQKRRPADRDGGYVAPPEDITRAHVRRWLKESNKSLGGRLEAGVIALEYQKNGWPHFHPLLRLAGGLMGGELQQLGQRWFKLRGYAKLEPPIDQVDVAAYASKYLVKDLSRGDVTFWPFKGEWPGHQPEIGTRGRSAKVPRFGLPTELPKRGTMAGTQLAFRNRG